jgi:hypothetical protein
MLEVLPGTPALLLAAWLVFSPEGGASWIVGLGPNDNPAVLQASRMVPGRAFRQISIRAKFIRKTGAR